MKILFLGDVVAKSGRQAVSLRLKALQQSCGADFTIVNGENAAHGKGITARIYRAFKDDGVDVVTLGNHAFSKHEILDHLDGKIRELDTARNGLLQKIAEQDKHFRAGWCAV